MLQWLGVVLAIVTLAASWHTAGGPGDLASDHGGGEETPWQCMQHAKHVLRDLVEEAGFSKYLAMSVTIPNMEALEIFPNSLCNPAGTIRVVTAAVRLSLSPIPRRALTPFSGGPGAPCGICGAHGVICGPIYTAAL